MMLGEMGDWVKRLGNAPVPIQRRTQTFFKEHQDEPNLSISKLWEIVQFDPGLCLNYLRKAGKSKRTRVCTVSHAMLLMGLPQAIRMPLTLPTLEETCDLNIRREILRIYSRAFHAGLQARAWAEISKSGYQEEVFTACLNHEFLLYLLLSQAPAQALRLVKLQDKPQLDLAAEKALGVSISSLSLHLAKLWQLPELLIEMQTEQVKPVNRKYLIASSACQLDRCTENGWEHEELQTLLMDVAKRLHKPLASVVKLVHITAARAARYTNEPYAPVIPAAVSLPLLAIPKSVKQVIIPAKRKKPPAVIFKECLTQIANNRESDHRKIFQYAFKGLMEGLGFSRVIYLQRSEDQQAVVIKYLIDRNKSENHKKLRIQLSQGDVFDLLLRKPQTLWLSEKNRDKYWPRLPWEFRAAFKLDCFFLMSIFVNQKPLGLFFVDNQGSSQLNENQLKYFKYMVQCVAKAIQANDAKNIPNQQISA